nr:hypothetical protein [Tanacetum cinerariifolium]
SPSIPKSDRMPSKKPLDAIARCISDMASGRLAPVRKRASEAGELQAHVGKGQGEELICELSGWSEIDPAADSHVLFAWQPIDKA